MCMLVKTHICLRVLQARIQDFLGGGPKFEILRAKYWYVMVTNSNVMRGGGVGAGRGEFPPPSSAKRGSFDVSLNY